MIKLKSLLVENMDIDDFSKLVTNAYVAIFDIDPDTIRVHKQKKLASPAFVHSWFHVFLKLFYKNRHFIVTNRIVHHKFPPEEKRHLNSLEWDEMLKHAEKFDRQDTTIDDFKQRNPLLRFGAGVYEDPTPDKKTNFFDKIDIGEVDNAKTLSSLVTKVKHIIDDEDSSGGDEHDPSPIKSPDSELTPALVHENKIKNPLMVYHGTGVKFRKFNLKYSTQGILWFTSDKEKIKSNSVGAQGKGYIITAEVTIKNPAGWKEYENLLLDELRGRGYDGVILPDPDGTFDCFVFKPDQVKIVKYEKAEETA